MKKVKHHNEKVAAARGADWVVALREGREQSRMYPSLLALARMKKELRQADLADKLQMSLSSYCAIERGRRPVKLLVARVIAEEVGKSLSAVFYKDEKSEKYFVKCSVPVKKERKKKGERK